MVLNDHDITKSRGSITIDAASVNTGEAKRDEDLRSGKFLDVARYPIITFVSRKKAAVGKPRVEGGGSYRARRDAEGGPQGGGSGRSNQGSGR